MNENKQRNVFFDHAKALAIVLMVLLHNTYRYPVLTSIIGTFHMAVFFIIGGIFFRVQGVGFKQILNKGIRQLIVPYLCFSFLSLSICWISPYLHPELYPGLDSFPKIFKAAILGIFVGQDYYNGYTFLPNGALWFLLALFWCRLIAYFWISESRIRLVLRIIIIVFIISVILIHPLVWSLDRMTVSLPFFLLGYYLKDYFKKLEKQSVQVRIIISIVCALVLGLFTESFVSFGAGKIVGNVFVAYLRGLSGVVLLMSVCTFIPVSSKIYAGLSVLGVSTLTILVLHGYFTTVSKVVYTLFFGNPQTIHIIFAVVSTIITVICLSYVHKWLMRYAPFVIGHKS